MLTEGLSETVLALPPEERMELARRLIESVVWPAALNEAVTAGIRRTEDVASGRTAGLTEEAFLYGLTEEQLIIGSLIPSRSDPLTWLARFGADASR